MDQCSRPFVNKYINSSKHKEKAYLWGNVGLRQGLNLAFCKPKSLLFCPFPFLFARKWCKQSIVCERKQAQKQHLFSQGMAGKAMRKRRGITAQKPHPVFETKAWRAGDARLKNCDTAATSHCVPTPTPKKLLAERTAT